MGDWGSAQGFSMPAMMPILKGPNFHTATEDYTQELPAHRLQGPAITIMASAVAEVCNSSLKFTYEGEKKRSAICEGEGECEVLQCSYRFCRNYKSF